MLVRLIETLNENGVNIDPRDHCVGKLAKDEMKGLGVNHLCSSCKLATSGAGTSPAQAGKQPQLANTSNKLSSNMFILENAQSPSNCISPNC